MNIPSVFCKPTRLCAALSVSIIRARFSRAVFILVSALLLMAACWLWRPGERVQAYGRLTINAPADEPFVLPEAKVGVEYEHQFQTEGGLAPLKWSAVAGTIPPGIRLEENGKLRGVPTLAKAEAYAFVMEVADSAKTPQRFSLPCAMMVQAAPLRIVAGAPKLRIVTSRDNESSGTAPETETKDDKGGPQAVSPQLSNKLGMPNPSLRNAVSGTSIGGNLTAPVAETTPSCDPIPSVTSIVKICGKLRPASLDRTLSWLRESDLPNMSPETEDEKKLLRYRFYDVVVKNSDGKDAYPLIEAGRTANDSLRQGRLNHDTCDFDCGVKPGLQKQAVINLLRDTLVALKDRGGSPKNAIPSGFPGKQEYSSLSAETIERQILMLEDHLGNVKVKVTGENKRVVAEDHADADGNFRFALNLVNSDSAEEGQVKNGEELTIATAADDYKSSRTIRFRDGAPNIWVYLPIEDRPVSLLTRAVVGYQQSAAAASKIEQNIFFDLFISKTIGWRQTVHPDFGERLRAWTSIRTLSVPQSGEGTISATVSGFASTVSNLKVKDAVRVIDAQGGLELRLTGNNALLPSFDGETKQKFSISLIASLGFVIPTDPRDSISKFIVDSSAPGLPPAVVGKGFVAFIPSDRDRFFRQYYAGLRLQTFFFNRYNIPLQRFPAQLDFTVGQNEYVSGGILRGPVIRVDGYFPLPYDKVKFINLYGTALMRPTRVSTGTPLVLLPAPDNTVPAPDTILIPVRQFDRDYYKFGVGIDFMSLIQRIKESRNPAN